MKAIVLCAGFGTRLLPITRNTPKALLEIAGKTVLDYLIPQLLEVEHLSAIHLVSNGRFAGQFYAWQERWLDELDRRKVALHLHSDGSQEERDRLGSLGALNFVLRHIDNPRGTLVTAGDTIYRFSFRDIAREFENSSRNMVVALEEPNRQVRQRLTVLEFGDDDRVVHVQENPEQPAGEWICPRLYFFQPSALAKVPEYLKEGGKDALAEFVDHLATTDDVVARRLEGTQLWLDLATKYAYNRAENILTGAAPSDVLAE